MNLSHLFSKSSMMEKELDQLKPRADSSQSPKINASIIKLFKEIKSGKISKVDCRNFKEIPSFLKEAKEISKKRKEYLSKLLEKSPPSAERWKKGLNKLIKNISTSHTIKIQPKLVGSAQISIPDAIKNVLFAKLDSIVNFDLYLVDLLKSLSHQEFESLEKALENSDEFTQHLFVCAKKPPLTKGDRKFIAFCRRKWAVEFINSKPEDYKAFIDEGANIKIIKNYFDSQEKEKLVQTLEFSNCTEPFIELLNLGFPAVKISEDTHKILCCEKLNDEALKRVIKKNSDNKFLNFLAHDLSGHSVDKFKIAIARKECYPAIPFLLEEALKKHNYALIDAIFSSISENDLDEYAKIILDQLESTEDPIIGEIVIKHYPDIISLYVSENLLEIAVLQQKGGFVRWLLEHGMILNQEKVNHLLSLALKTYNLEIIQSLYVYAKKNKIKVEKDFESYFLENLPPDKDAQLNYLLGYFMNSSLTRSMKIIDLFPSLSGYVPRILELISVMIRFPEKYKDEINFGTHTTKLESEITDNSEYIKKSREYAEANREFIDSILPDLPNLTHKDLLDQVALERFGRNKLESNLAYIYDRFGPKSPYVDEVTTTSISGRYGHSLRHFSEIAFDREGKKIIGHYPSIEIVNNDPEIHYINPVRKINVPITKLGDFRLSPHWHHTKRKTIEELQPELERLHQELLDKSLSQPENRQIFKEKMARYYYLIATLSEKARGTPHNAMMILNIFYAYHGLPPPIPVLNHFFLDNTMLMLPIEVVIDQWEAFFEPIPFRGLVKRARGG